MLCPVGSLTVRYGSETTEGVLGKLTAAYRTSDVMTARVERDVRLDLQHLPDWPMATASA